MERTWMGVPTVSDLPVCRPIQCFATSSGLVRLEIDVGGAKPLLLLVDPLEAVGIAMDLHMHARAASGSQATKDRIYNELRSLAEGFQPDDDL